MGIHDARDETVTKGFTDRLWRVGRSVGRTVYVVEGRNDPSDILVGMFDSEHLAQHVVEVHNWWVEVHKEADAKWVEWLHEQLPLSAQDDGAE
jgi:hypothetical protein